MCAVAVIGTQAATLAALQRQRTSPWIHAEMYSVLSPAPSRRLSLFCRRRRQVVIPCLLFTLASVGASSWSFPPCFMDQFCHKDRVCVYQLHTKQSLPCICLFCALVATRREPSWAFQLCFFTSRACPVFVFFCTLVSTHRESSWSVRPCLYKKSLRKLMVSPAVFLQKKNPHGLSSRVSNKQSLNCICLFCTLVSTSSEPSCTFKLCVSTINACPAFVLFFAHLFQRTEKAHGLPNRVLAKKAYTVFLIPCLPCIGLFCALVHTHRESP
jgi:hypothetical protein